MRVRDRGADLGAAILEDEHVVDVGARAERCAALGPEVDHLARAGGAERPERRVVLRRVEHDLAAVARASPASGSRTSARRTARAPRARRGRTGTSPTAGSAGLPRVDDVREDPGELVATQVRRVGHAAPRRAAAPAPLGAITSRSTCSLIVARACAGKPGSETKTSTSSSPAMRLRPRTPHFDVVGDDDEPLRRGDERAVGLGLEQVRRRQAGVGGDAVHAEEEHVEVQRADRVDGDRPDERVRRRPHAAGQHDGQVGPRGAVEDVGDLDRVRHDGQVGDVGEVVGEPPGRRAGGEADRLARLDEPAGRARDRLLLAELPVRLRLEARLLGAEPAAQRRAAVHLLDEPGRGEHVDVAADRHLRDGEQAGELAHADAAFTADLVDDQLLALGGKHRFSAVVDSHNTQRYRTARVKQIKTKIRRKRSPSCQIFPSSLDKSKRNMPCSRLVVLERSCSVLRTRSRLARDPEEDLNVGRRHVDQRVEVGRKQLTRRRLLATGAGGVAATYGLGAARAST